MRTTSTRGCSTRGPRRSPGARSSPTPSASQGRPFKSSISAAERSSHGPASASRNPPPRPPGAKLGNYLSKSSPSTEELWQVFFANPMDWWDDRKNKKNPKYPDFKHKHAGKALWVEANYNPPWVKSQLAILDSRMGSLQANGTSSSVSVMYSDDFAPF